MVRWTLATAQPSEVLLADDAGGSTCGVALLPLDTARRIADRLQRVDQCSLPARSEIRSDASSVPWLQSMQRERATCPHLCSRSHLSTFAKRPRQNRPTYTNGRRRPDRPSRRPRKEGVHVLPNRAPDHSVPLRRPNRRPAHGQAHPLGGEQLHEGASEL